MKIVIDIPERAYELLNNEGVDWLGAEYILGAVANGTPLEEIPNPCIECSQNCCVSDLNGEKCSCQKIYVLAESEEE